MADLDHILFQIKDYDVPNSPYDTCFAPFAEEKDFTVCLEWQVLSGITENSSGKKVITTMLCGCDGRTFNIAYYSDYMYTDIFGNRATNRVFHNYKINRIVITFDGETRKTYARGSETTTTSTATTFKSTDATIKIGSSNSKNVRIREFVFYDYAMTEEEVMEYINAPIYFSSEHLLESRRRILMVTPHLESPIPANPLTFKSNMTTKLKEGKVYFTPVQEGEGDPSPDNVRPIHGWDGITVTKCGKNLLDGVWRAGRYIDGAWSETNTWRTSNLIPVKANESYCVSANNEATPMNMYLHLFDSNGDWISGSYGTGVIQTTSDTAFLAVCNTRSIIIEKSHNLQLELGSTPTAYEPYTETQITIPFPQTIYGGYVDLVNGEVVEEWDGFTFDGVNKKLYRDYTSSGNTNYIKAYWVYWNPVSRTTAPVMCDTLSVTRNHNSIASSPCLYASSSGQMFGGLILGTKAEYPDLAEGTAQDRIDACNDWFENIPTKVIYKLATPVVHSLDPVTIRTLKGTNTIYSDTNGNIEITYWKH